MKKTHFPFVLILGVLVAGVSGYLLLKRLDCQKMCISFSLLEQQSPKEVYEDTEKSYRAIYQTAEGLVRVEQQLLKPDEATQISDITLMRMDGMFQNALSPYPGPLSDVITCDTKFKPHPQQIEVDGQSMTLFSGYLDNRMQYGTCQESDVAYRGFNALFYCTDQSSWYRIELLVTPDTAKEDTHYFELLKSIRC